MDYRFDGRASRAGPNVIMLLLIFAQQFDIFRPLSRSKTRDCISVLLGHDHKMIGNFLIVPERIWEYILYHIEVLVLLDQLLAALAYRAKLTA